VSVITISPDGRYALSCGRAKSFGGRGGIGMAKVPYQNNNLYLWDMESGQCLHTLIGHTDWTNSLTFSANGCYALSGSDDHSVRLWEVKSGRCLRAFEGHTNRVTAVCLSADARYALSGSWDHIMRLWEISTGVCLRVFEGHTGHIDSICLSADGKQALSGSSDKTMRLWDVASGQCLRVFKADSANTVDLVAFLVDGRYALSHSDLNILRVWDLASGQCVQTIKNILSDERHFFSNNGRYAISINNGIVQLWVIEFRQPVKAPMALCAPRSMVNIKEKENEYIKNYKKAEESLSKDEILAAYQYLQSAQAVTGYEGNPQVLTLLNQLVPHGIRIGVKSFWPIQTIEGHSGGVRSLTFSPDGSFVLSSCYDNDYMYKDPNIRLGRCLYIWDVMKGQCIRTIEGNFLSIDSVAISPDGYYALADYNQTICLLEIANGKCCHILKGHKEGVNSVAFSNDGHYALSGSDDKTLRLWDIVTGLCLRTFTGHQRKVFSVDISMDGCYLLSGSGTINSSKEKENLRLWDVASGQCLRFFPGHTDNINTVIFSPNGKCALSGSDDLTLRLWDIANGQLIHSYEGSTGQILAAAFSPDGRFILSGNSDNKMRLWNTASGQCLCVLEGHTRSVTAVAFSPDGRYVLSGSEDTTLKLWELEWELDFPDPADWDDGAQPYIDNFLTLHRPYAGTLPVDREPTEEEITLALSRQGTPTWTEDDFQQLLYTLGCAGYGWLRPEGVRRKLEELARERG